MQCSFQKARLSVLGVADEIPDGRNATLLSYPRLAALLIPSTSVSANKKGAKD